MAKNDVFLCSTKICFLVKLYKKKVVAKNSQEVQVFVVVATKLAQKVDGN